jgi:hypothetical protein
MASDMGVGEQQFQTDEGARIAMISSARDARQYRIQTSPTAITL